MNSESDHEQHAAERFAREQQLQAIRDELSEVKDGLGEPIDPGITETLVGLKANGINTTQSCEGHDDRAEALPWVDVGATEPDGWKESEELKVQWTEENTVIAERLKHILDKWQAQRIQEGQTPDDAHVLELHERGIYGAVRLEARDQVRVSRLTSTERVQSTVTYKAAMREFAEYLQSLFLDEQQS